MQRMVWLSVGASLLAAGAARLDDPPKTTPAVVGTATFQVPEKWVKQKPTRQFRILQWGIPKAEGDEATPVLYVSELSGPAGGVEGNIRRWVNEYEEKDGDAKPESFTVEGIKFTFVAVTGTFKESMGGPFSGGEVKHRKDYTTLGAVVEIPDSESTYFFKMVGPKKSVGAQKDALLAALKSAKIKK